MGTLLVITGFWFLLSSSQSSIHTYIGGFPTAMECERARESKIEKYKDMPAVTVGACFEVLPNKLILS